MRSPVNVQEIRDRIDAGVYDTPEVINAVIDRLWADIAHDSCLGRRVIQSMGCEMLRVQYPLPGVISVAATRPNWVK